MPNTLYDALFAPHLGSDRGFLYMQDGQTISYDAFLTRAAQFAHTITKLGLEPGDRLAVQIDKSPDALAVYAASVMTGAIFLPLNTAYTAAEVRHFLENSGAKLFLCTSANKDALSSVAEVTGSVLHDLGSEGEGSFADMSIQQAGLFSPVDRGPDDLAAFLYTSGTTGRSKGAMLSHENLLSNAQTLTQSWAFTEDDVLMHALPIFHTHGLFVGTNITLLAGGSLIFLPGFDSDAIVRLMPRATTMMGVPTFYTRLLDNDHFTRDLTAHMRLFVSGSAPLLSETHERFQARTGHRILERYGMTETNMNTSNPYDGDRRAGTVGQPLPGVEVRITDPESDAVLSPGEVGMVEVRGPNVFKGYWQMPEKTAEEMRSDGFFITGDLGVFSADGYLTIVGRSKDLIISGGYNIYPKEVEAVLDDHPAVAESAVIGVPHPDLGEAVVGVIVPSDGLPDTQAIIAALGDQLARFKRPRHIATLSALPRNTMGKVQKNVLREQFKAVFTRPA